MKTVKIHQIKTFLVYLVSFMVMVLGFSNMIVYLPFKFEAFRYFENNYSYLSINAFAIHRSFSVVLGFMLVLISYRLSKRVKSAWLMSVLMIAFSLYLNFHRYFFRVHLITVAEILILIILIFLRSEFIRDLNPLSIKRGLLLAGISILMVVLYTAIGLFIMKRHFVGIEGFCDSVLSSAKILYFMDVSAVQPKTRMAVLFVRSAVLLNWTILLLALVFILKPLIYRPISTIHDREKVRNLLKSYGCNPISYVAMESDKKYFFGTVAEGVIAYTIINRVLLCAGDPICKTEEMPMFLSEILIFCRKNDYQICFCQITEQFMDAFKNMGFGISKYGEECMFELSEYSLEGHAASRLRQALRRAERIGIRVFEYDPQLHNNIDLEKQIMDVSSEWLAQKKSGELTFMLGTVSLNNPCDRRYFVAVDETKTVQGFIAFTPFMGGRGYMADVTRRRNNAPFGVMEKLTVDAFFKMRDEGVKWGSLGLAPLYNVKSAASKGIIPDIFNFIYENLNMFYGFKTLYQYKQKYAPTFWEPRYLAYYPIIMTPQIAYSIVKAQNPKGISNYLLMNLKRKIKE